MNYNEFPQNYKKATHHIAKKEYAQALDKECKRMSVLYPFLPKSQIRSKAKESLSNASKTTPCKRRLTTPSKGKAPLNFIEPRTGANKSGVPVKHLHRTTGEELELAPKTYRKSQFKCRHNFGDDADENDYNYDSNNDNEEEDPDYLPCSSHKATPKPLSRKTMGAKESKPKKANKTSKKNLTCGFMELGENACTTEEEVVVTHRKLSSKMKPIKSKFRTFKEQAPTEPAIKMSNKTYTGKDKHKDDFPNKPEKISCDHPVEALRADNMFDKLIIDDSTQQSHVSESPDSTTADNFSRKSCEEVAAARIPAAQHNVIVPVANDKTTTILSQSEEEIFAKSEKQPPKTFPKFSVENGYEVITLSSDSEDDTITITRSGPQDVKYLSNNPNQIKVEKDKTNPSNESNTSVKEQPNKSVLRNEIAKANTTHPTNTTAQEIRPVPMPRGILKHTPQRTGFAIHGTGQTSRTVQTPNLVKYQSPPKVMKDVSTQMTPPRVQIKIRPQMKDEASEVNMDDEQHSESSSLDSPCFIQATHEASFLQQRNNATMRYMDKTIIGRARQFQCPQVVTPKLCSVQTQTAPRDYNFHFLPNQSALENVPLQNGNSFETPRKRYVSWKEDRVLNLTEDNAAQSNENKEKLLKMASTGERDHDGFFYSLKLELELLDEKIKAENSISDGTAIEPGVSNWNVSSPESEASDTELPPDALPQNGILDEEEVNELENEWCDMFNSPIHCQTKLGANRICTDVLHSKANENLNLRAAKNIGLTNIMKEQNTFERNSNTGTTMPSSVEDSQSSSDINDGRSTIALEKPRLAQPLWESQESTEATYSSTCSDEIVSSYEKNWEMSSEASTLTDSPLNLGMLNDKFAFNRATSTPALAPTRTASPKQSLLESLLAKMRRFGQSSSINKNPEKWLQTPKRPPLLPNKVMTKPPQKKLKVERSYSMLPNLPSPIRRTPRTPQNVMKNAYGNSLMLNGCLIKKPDQTEVLNRQNESSKKTEQAKEYVEEITTRKDNLLCDLFDVATPKSAGGTLNRYLGHSGQFHPRSDSSEDSSDAFVKKL